MNSATVSDGVSADTQSPGIGVDIETEKVRLVRPYFLFPCWKWERIESMRLKTDGALIEKWKNGSRITERSVKFFLFFFASDFKKRYTNAGHFSSSHGLQGQHRAAATVAPEFILNEGLTCWKQRDGWSSQGGLCPPLTSGSRLYTTPPPPAATTAAKYNHLETIEM